MSGKIEVYWKKKILKNQFFGIEITYTGNKTDGDFFIHGNIDQNSNSYAYFAFDTIDAKELFDTIYKIPWIGIKTAYNVWTIPLDQLKKAIQELDFKFLESLPGIWPKTAKRILIDLKNTFWKEELQKLEIDDKLFKEIVSSLKTLWYQAETIKQELRSCPIALDKSNLPEIMKRLIGVL